MCLLSHFHSFPVAQRSVTIKDYPFRPARIRFYRAGADIIMFLYRDAYYSDEGDKSVAECIVAKNRHGQTDKVQLGWIGEYTLFRGLDFRRDDE